MRNTGSPAEPHPFITTKPRSHWPSWLPCIAWRTSASVSSLTNGMNLVAKIVASRADEDGVLVLQRARRRRGGAARSAHHQSLRRGRVCGRNHARYRHERRGARPSDAGHATHRRWQRLQLGVRHPRRSRKPLDQAVTVRRARIRGRAGVVSDVPVGVLRIANSNKSRSLPPLLTAVAVPDSPYQQAVSEVPMLNLYAGHTIITLQFSDDSQKRRSRAEWLSIDARSFRLRRRTASGSSGQWKKWSPSS